MSDYQKLTEKTYSLATKDLILFLLSFSSSKHQVLSIQNEFSETSIFTYDSRWGETRLQLLIRKHNIPQLKVPLKNCQVYKIKMHENDPAYVCAFFLYKSILEIKLACVAENIMSYLVFCNLKIMRKHTSYSIFHLNTDKQIKCE